MPFGPNPVVGLISYAVIKLAGYSLYGQRLNKFYHNSSTNPLSFGLMRTLLGTVAGFLAGSLFLGLMDTGLVGFLFLLIPIRFGEWWIIISRCFRLVPKKDQRFRIQSTLGIAWSFLLDIPVIASFFVIPGAMWIC